MPFLPLDNVLWASREQRRLEENVFTSGPEKMDPQPNLIQQLRDSLTTVSRQHTHTRTHDIIEI